MEQNHHFLKTDKWGFKRLNAHFVRFASEMQSAMKSTKYTYFPASRVTCIDEPIFLQ